MATLTTEQIEAKKQQLKQLAAEAEQLKNELVEAGAWPLDENELNEVAGGYVRDPKTGIRYPSTHDERLKKELGKKDWWK